jgi:hypothetical protein
MIKLTEKQYQKNFIQDLRNRWFRCYKIPDDAMGFKPFDIISIQNERPRAIELKVSNLKNDITYKQAYWLLRPNQIGSLQAFQEAGGISCISVWQNHNQTEIMFPFTLLSQPHDCEIS